MRMIERRCRALQTKKFRPHARNQNQNLGFQEYSYTIREWVTSQTRDDPNLHSDENQLLATWLSSLTRTHPLDKSNNHT
jgi:hypothetical protein